MSTRTPTFRRSRGTALLVALFLVIVVAMLGVFALRISGAENTTTTLDLLARRADIAANNGLEIAARHASNGNCAAIAVPVIFNLDGFTLTVNCTSVSATSYRISAVAIRQATLYGSPDFVQRRVSRQVGRSPEAGAQAVY